MLVTQPASALPGDTSSQSLEVGLNALRLRSALLLGLLRFAAAVGVALIGAVLGLVYELPDWRASLPGYLAYAVVALLLLLALRSERLRVPVGALAPLVDVAVVFLIQRATLSSSPHPAGVAGWSLGPFVLLVLFASVAMRPALLYPTALAGFVAEAALQRLASVGYGAVMVSGFVLLLAAAVCHWAQARVVELSARLLQEDVERRVLLERSEASERAAQALEEQHQRLLTAQREAEMLTSLVVHDLKGPLTSVLTLVDLVRDELSSRSDAAELGEDLRIALGQGHRLVAMVQDLVAISRLEKGALKAQPSATRLRELLQDVATAYAAAAAERGASIGVADVADVSASLDRELLQRALENFVTNALAVVRAGDRIELAADIRTGEVTLIVRNSGPPVGADVKARLFERHNSSGKSRGNAGLGLYFCRLVARAHGGEAQLEDEPGWGASFTLRLGAEASPARLGQVAAA